MQRQEVAVVTGASHGVGRGVSIALHEAGFRVFATGRAIADAVLPNGVSRIACDHLLDDETAAAFAAILAETGRIDVLTNCAWGGYERIVENGRFTWGDPFWLP